MDEYVAIYCDRCGEYIAPCSPPAPPVPVLCARCAAERREGDAPRADP